MLSPLRPSPVRRRRLTGTATPRPRVVRAPSYRTRIQAALERCGSRDRLAMALVLVDRLSLAEAADVLGIPAVGVDRAVQSTLARLRRIPVHLDAAPAPLRKAS